MTLDADERRALGIIAALLLLATGARWLERPRPLLEGPAVDVAGLEAESRAARAGDAPGSSGPPARVDPNTATAEDLERLPGVGPSLAARIIEERERAPFRTLEDLTRVRGIGAALATRMAGLVSLPAGPKRPDPAANTGLTPEKKSTAPVPETMVAGPVDFNDISSADLQKVPGVGPALAARLLARRDSLRRFTRWEQVDEVAGVGPVMLSRLKERLFIRP